MRSLLFGLIIHSLVACDNSGLGHDCGASKSWPKESCPAPKTTLTCPPLWPPADAACPAQLYPLLSWAFNNALYMYVSDRIITPDFRFVDETAGIRSDGQDYEVGLVDQLRCHYHGAEFEFSISSRVSKGACERACGIVFMRLYHTRTEGLIVQDQTCMTACPDERNVWRFTEWRVLQRVPLVQEEEGFRQASWGEARRMEWEEWEENPCVE